MRVSPKATLDAILVLATDEISVDYDSHTFSSSYSSAPIALDKSIQFYIETQKLDSLHLEVGPKSYSTMAVQENNQDVVILALNGFNYIVMAATEEKLIQKAVDTGDDQDMDFVDTLLLTFRSFAEPTDFFARLIDQFNAQLPPDPTAADMEYFEKYKDLLQRR